jgi:hypothetical protein
MASISITKSSAKSVCFESVVGGFLALTFAFFSLRVHAADEENLYKEMYLWPESPPSSHMIHWQKNRSFSLSFLSREATFDEKNKDSKAAFSGRETVVDAVFQRQVSPSVGFFASLTHVKGDSSFVSDHVGITSDVDRDVRSSLGSVAGSYKIMDALILALRAGYQVSQLEFSKAEAFSQRAYRLNPALAWKSNAFEVAVYQARVYRSKTISNKKQQFAENGVLLSSLLDEDWQWQVWIQRNAQPVCCAFVESKRTIYGGRVFLPAAGYSVSPGYRFLSEFQASQQPGTIEDVARHNFFVSLTSDWEVWKPSLNLSYDFAADDDAPSSFGSTSNKRSEVKARTLQFGAALGRVW